MSAGSGAGPRRKTNLVHFKRYRTLLVARYRKYYENENNNNIQLPLIFPKKLFLVFLVAFASISFIWFKLPWRYLIRVTKGELAPKGQKLKPKAENKDRFFEEKPVAGKQPRKQTVFWA